jgi:hypothetical protein
VIFRRRLPQQPTASWAGQGAAFWIGLQIGRVAGSLAGWSRLARASIVISGMALAIPLFWFDYPGWAVVVGFVALTIFWLAVPVNAIEAAHEEQTA